MHSSPGFLGIANQSGQSIRANLSSAPRPSSARLSLRFLAGLFALLLTTGHARAQGVSGVTVTAPGTGYTTPPAVSFSGGGGSGAAATAFIFEGGVTNVTVTAPGSGYTSTPSVIFTGGGGSGAAATALTDNLVFTNNPNLWAVGGGVYRYTPTAQTSANGATINFGAIQLPSWLNFNGTQLTGTPPTSEEGLRDLVVLQASDSASNIATLSFRINVGNAVGPTSSPPGGGSVQWVTGMPQVARGGDTELVSGVTTEGNIPIFWGLIPSGFGMEMDYNGPPGFSGDFTVPGNFTFASYEIGYWYPLGSNMSAGFGIWQQQTFRPSSVGGGVVFNYLTATVTDLSSGVVPLVPADTLGLDGTVGALAQVDGTGGLHVAMTLDANSPSNTPSLYYFNSIQFKLPTDRVITQVESAFYWVNTAPVLSDNNGLTALQGGTVVLTPDMLFATDNEQTPGLVTFTLSSGDAGGPPYNGSLQVDDGSGTWAQTLGPGDSFTAAQILSGWVRYQNNGSYQTSDGFEFSVTDGFGGTARDGSYTTFTFPIDITLVEHAPVTGSLSLNGALGGTSTGTLPFTDPDMGNESDTYTVSLTGSSTLGTLIITDPSTGAYSFTAGTTPGTESVGWQVTNGAFTTSGTISITVANEPPVLSPLTITGGASQPIIGTLQATDPNVPAEDYNLAVQTPPAKGNVSFNANHVIYNANPGRFGADSFTVVATDTGGSTSAPQTVNVMIQPDTISSDSLFISGQVFNGFQEVGVIQRVNPANGDIYLLATNLGNSARGMGYWPGAQKLLVLVNNTNPAINGLIAVDPITGSWSFGTLITSNNLLVFPISLSTDGPGNVLVANGNGGVVEVTLATGAQQSLTAGLPGSAFVTAAVPSPDGSGNVFIADNESRENPDNSNLYLSNLTAAPATTPVSFSPAGDISAIIPDGPTMVAVARGGVPVETIGVNPVSYTPLSGTPSAPYALPVSLVSYGPMSSWLITDGANGSLYSQVVGSESVQPVSVAGLSTAWGLFVLQPATHLSVVAPASAVAGAPVSVTVTPLDAANNPAYYAGTVHFTSSDGSAVLPADTTVASGSGTFTVTFNSTGSQTVTATDTANSSIAGTSGPVIVSAPVAPQITAQPMSVTANQGSMASFTVVATGIPAPTYQWRLNGANLPGATSATLTLTNLQLANAGSYSVVVTNIVSSVTSKAASLVVTAGPVITTQPVSATVNSGANATFTVVATGVPIPTYQWTFNGSPISGATRASVTLSKVTAANAGNYVVTATNSMGHAVSSTAALVVDTAPQVTSQPTSQLVNAGASASLSVVATGIPAPSYQWYQGGVLVPGATSSTISFPSVQPSNAGSYTVVVTNSVSSVTSSAATLAVNGAPMITTQPSSVTVVAGNDPVFTVVATGTPAPTYQWYLGGTPISGATKASLTIINAKAANAGTYTVTATNILGNAPSAGAVLTVITPPSITTQPVSKTVSTSANVTFTVVASGTATLTYQWAVGGVAIPGATATSYTLTNVQPSSNGTYTVTVRNSGGSAISNGAVLKVN